MWEIVTPQQDGTNTTAQQGCVETQPQKQARQGKPESGKATGDNYLLWAQIIICILVLATTFAAHALSLPLYRQFRVAFDQATAQTDADYLGETRKFIKFTQETWQSLCESAQQVFATAAAVPQPEESEQRDKIDAATANTAAAMGIPKESAVYPAVCRIRHGKSDNLQQSSGAQAENQNEKEAPQTEDDDENDDGEDNHTNSAAPYGCSLENGIPRTKMAAPLKRALVVTSPYGWRKNPLAETEKDFHTGVDLSATQGTPVYAAADGVVRQAGCGKSYGNYLRILHKGGDETLYAHLKYLFVRPGQMVTQGSCIAASGQTGDVTGPHLHFELLQGGVRYDPSGALGLS